MTTLTNTADFSDEWGEQKTVIDAVSQAKLQSLRYTWRSRLAEWLRSLADRVEG